MAASCDTSRIHGNSTADSVAAGSAVASPSGSETMTLDPCASPIAAAAIVHQNYISEAQLALRVKVVQAVAHRTETRSYRSGTKRSGCHYCNLLLNIPHRCALCGTSICAARRLQLERDCSDSMTRQAAKAASSITASRQAHLETVVAPRNFFGINCPECCQRYPGLVTTSVAKLKFFEERLVLVFQ